MGLTITTPFQLISSYQKRCHFLFLPFSFFYMYFPIMAVHYHFLPPPFFHLSLLSVCSCFHCSVQQPHSWREKSIHTLSDMFQLGIWGSGGWIKVNKGFNEKNERRQMKLTNMEQHTGRDNGRKKKICDSTSGFLIHFD